MAIIDTLLNKDGTSLYPRTKIEAVEGLIERLANVEKPNITSTTETTMPNSYDGRLLVEEIGGESQQGENPSPTYPQEIKKTVVSEIKTHGKNFLPNVLQNTTINGITATVNSDKSITFNGTANGMADFYLFGGISDNGNYIKIPKGSKILNAIGGGGLIAREKTSGALTGFNTIQRTLDEKDCYFYGVFIRFASDKTANNETAYPMISVDGGEYEPYTESVITLSQPIELYGIGDVQDVIVGDKVVRKLVHDVYDGDENWRASSSLVGRYYLGGVGCKHYGKTLCSHAKGIQSSTTTTNECYINTSSDASGRFTINTPFATVEEWKAHLAENPMEVVFELAEEVTEDLPLSDQIALNSLSTYDGITYLEFDSEIEPTFKGEYGTSKVGGYTLEGMLAGRNGELYGKNYVDRITALEATVVNNI